MNPNTEYERFTQEIYQQLVNLDVVRTTKVQHDVKEHGIEYVLQLDHGDAYKGLGEDATYIVLAYNYRGWKGINGVRDDTPGFTVVLSEGDMRLYKIEMPES